MDILDYKYIEQLLDRYFEAQTSLQEEHILREFFAQAEVPEHLLPWRSLFVGQKSLADAHLTERFDERLLHLVGEDIPTVKARRITMRQRIRPLFKAAALVAFAIVIGSAIEHATNPDAVASEQLTATSVQDELDASETNALDIRSAKASELIDSLTQRVVPN